MEDTFSKRVYAAVAKIPRGAVATYGQIAKMVGSPRAARYVGYALARIRGEGQIPCHRVVNGKGELAPEFVFGAKEIQRNLLENEGIAFLEDGRIDMEASIWRNG